MKNPIAKAVRLIKPKVVQDKRRKELTQRQIEELHEYADKERNNNNRKLKP